MHLHFSLRKMRQRYIWEHTRFFITSIHYTMRQLHSIAIRLAIQTAFCTFVFQLSKKETALYLRAISVFFPLHFAHLYFSLHYIRLHYTDLRSRSTEPASSPVLHILVPAFQGLSSWNYNRCVNLFQNCNWWVNASLTWSMFNWCSAWWTVTEILQTEQTLYKGRFRMLKHKLFPL